MENGTEAKREEMTSNLGNEEKSVRQEEVMKKEQGSSNETHSKLAVKRLDHKGIMQQTKFQTKFGSHRFALYFALNNDFVHIYTS